MRITFIGSFVKTKTGIERINEELIKRLIQDDEIEKIDIIAPKQRAHLQDIVIKSDKVRLQTFPTSFLKLLFFIPRFIKTIGGNPVCVIANIRPIAIIAYLCCFFKYQTKIIQIVPDIIAWHYPKLFPFIVSLSFKIFGILFKNFPSLYIVHSEFTKNDLITEWGIDEKKIKVVKLGTFIKPHQPRDNFGSKKILFVGTIEPRKGLDKLLDAYEIIKQEIPDVELIICGKIGWKVKDLVLKLNKMISTNTKVKYLGYVDDDKLINLYREVDVCVYPSFYEGFGLPPLEAMACGCPVIVSNTSSLPEVVGEAGITVDPIDVKQLATAIKEVILNDALKRKLSIAGIQKAEEYDLNVNLLQLIEVIKNA
ncbi:MAG: glycosyltransferase family 1 protein [Candidatus Kryptonium sp.]|nr:glycosyltransferase family 4 protein [Candidatus Kryptonium sp.]MCX7763251.1 glycosyltransferase family 4 protein [Candidatus Kryptonium sp.]MDW8109138.1 glycosyltransferase family 1 protein [Candidatus Kryptonium sp.]